MYKILTRLHTLKPGVFRFHMIQNEEGEWMDYQAETKEEAELEAIKILERVGCLDLKVVQEEPYYIDIKYDIDADFNEDNEEARALSLINYVGWGDLKISDNRPFSIDMIWGEREENKTRHYINITSPNICQCEPRYMDNIVPGSSRSTTITFVQPVESFHLIINGEKCDGIPSWIDYMYLSDTQGVLTFNGIKKDYEIEVIVDGEYDKEIMMVDNEGNVYHNFMEAIDNSSDGAELTLLQNETLTEGITAKKNLTLDLAGYNISYNPDGELISMNGNESDNHYVVNLINSSGTESVVEGGLNFRTKGESFDLTIGDNVVVVSSNPVYFKGTDKEGQFTCNLMGTLEVTEGSNYAGIQGNGTKGCGGSVINIYDGANIIAQTTGIYQPQNGIINIFGGIIDAQEAISMKRGTLNVYDGLIHSYGEYCNPAKGNNDGSEHTGAAISLTSNDGYPGSINVNIYGGTMISDNGNALYEGIAMRNGSPVAASSLVESINIQNGRFSGERDYGAVSINKAANVSISGGKYNTNIESLLTENYRIATNREDDRFDYPYVVVSK